MKEQVNLSTKGYCMHCGNLRELREVTYYYPLVGGKEVISICHQCTDREPGYVTIPLKSWVLNELTLLDRENHRLYRFSAPTELQNHTVFYGSGESRVSTPILSPTMISLNYEFDTVKNNFGIPEMESVHGVAYAPTWICNMESLKDFQDAQLLLFLMPDTFFMVDGEYSYDSLSTFHQKFVIGISEKMEQDILKMLHARVNSPCINKK